MAPTPIPAVGRPRHAIYSARGMPPSTALDRYRDPRPSADGDANAGRRRGRGDPIVKTEDDLLGLKATAARATRGGSFFHPASRVEKPS